MALYFLSSAPRACWTFHLVLNFSILCNLFPISRSTKAKYLFWNSSRMARQTLGTNLHMVVWSSSQWYYKDMYVSPVARCLCIIASFRPTSKGFLKFVSSFFLLVVDAFLNEVKNCSQHPDKILETWSISLSGGSYSILFLVFERFRAWPRGLVAFFFSWVVLGAMVKVLAVWPVVWFWVLSANQSENLKKIKSVRNNRTLSFCRKFLWSAAGIFAVINDELQPQEDYIVFFWSQLPKWISPVWLDWDTACSSLVG